MIATVWLIAMKAAAWECDGSTATGWQTMIDAALKD